MELALNELTNKALALPLGERTLLAQRLWESIEDFIDSDVELEWLNVAERRWKDIEDGSVQCIPAGKAMKTARAQHIHPGRRTCSQETGILDIKR